MRNGKRILSLLLVALLAVVLLPAAAHADPPKGDTHLHSWSVVSETPATCTQPGTKTWRCSACGETYTEQTSPALGHYYEAEITTAPTCTETGVKTYTCQRCGDILTQRLPATGHSPVTMAAVAPTCTETGLTEGSKCETCGEILTPQETVPALGHAPVTIPGVEPTCTETGLTEGEKCDRCDAVLKEQEVLPAIDHDWDEGQVTTEPSGFTPGVRTFTCQHDPSHTRTEEIDPSPWLFATFTGSIPDFGAFEAATRDLTPLTITEQPVGGAITRYEDESVHLTCAATGGTGDYTYEWYSKKTVKLWGWNWPNYFGEQTEPGFDASTADYTYWCVVTDSAGETAATDKVDISYKIRIDKQPDNANLQPTGKATLACQAADGSGSYSYRWVDNQDNEIDVGSSIDVTEIGDYMCIATDDLTGESVSSYACEVYSIDPFRLASITEDCMLVPKENVMLVASFSGGVKEYEIWWDKDGGAIDSIESTDAAGNVISYVDTAEAGVYTVHGVDSMYATASGTVTVSAPKLTIVRQPEGGTIPRDGYLPISVTVSDGEGPYTYTLFKNGGLYGEITKDGTDGSFTVWYSGNYYIHIEDRQGREADSDTVTFEDAVFRIKKQSNAGVLYTATDTFTLSVEVEGGKEPYTYEWMQYRGDTPWYVKASTTATCVAGQPGKYACRITDAAGQTIRTKDIHVLYNGEAPRIIKQPSNCSVTPNEKGKYSFSLSCEAASGHGDYSCLEYRWEWKNEVGSWAPVGKEGKTLSGTKLGSYRCKVFDVVSHKSTYTQAVTVAESLTATIQLSHESLRTNQLFYDLQIQGGFTPYTVRVYLVVERAVSPKTVPWQTYTVATPEEAAKHRDSIPAYWDYNYQEDGEWERGREKPEAYAIITDADGRSTRVDIQ